MQHTFPSFYPFPYEKFYVTENSSQDHTQIVFEIKFCEFVLNRQQCTRLNDTTAFVTTEFKQRTTNKNKSAISSVANHDLLLTFRNVIIT
jgi:hypothetical protein